MKPLLLSVFLLGAVAGRAQISYTPADFPSAGNTYVSYTDHSAQLANAGGSGPGRTWNYASLRKTDSTASTLYNASGRPGASYLPSATIATGDGEFYRTDGSAFSFVGFANAGGSSDEFHPPLPVLPASYYGTGLSTICRTTERSAIPAGQGPAGADSNIRVSTYCVSFRTDGYGTLTIPAGTFPVLRVTETTDQADSLFYHTAAGYGAPYATSRDTSWRVMWLGKSYGPAMLQMDSAKNGQISQVRHANVPRSLSVSEPATAPVIVYPNPACDRVRFGLTGAAGTLRITDLQGRAAASAEFRNGQAEVDVRALPAGTYLYHAFLPDGRLRSGSFVVRH